MLLNTGKILMPRRGDKIMDETSTDGSEQHNLLPLVTHPSGITEYHCIKCGRTGMGGVRGSCRGDDR
jgi:hypothetical protein